MNISTVDFVKEIASACGWDGTKSPKNREFLSNLKDLLTNWGDVPYQKIDQEIELFKSRMLSHDFNPNTDGIVFVHCREPHEIARFAKEMGAYSLLIRRPVEESDEQSNHADAEVFNYNYDYTITNDGTLADLDRKAFLFLQVMGINNLK